MLHILRVLGLYWLLGVFDAQAEVVTLPTVEFASPIDYPKKELRAGEGASVGGDVGPFVGDEDGADVGGFVGAPIH